jgi:ABC-type iron transport system FetAB ATPase subunit
MALTTLHVGPISWEINRGSCVSLAGASGSGKSLLLRAIADLDPHDGEVSLDGQSVLSMSGHQWRQRVGLLPAEPFWWADRVGDHFAAADVVPLAALGLPPQSLEWTVSRCSTGERQRLAVARLLQNRPEVLLLDEPTAALDAQSVERVEALLEQYRREHQAVVIWVSHDPAQRRRVAQRHYAIQGSGLVEIEA